MGFTLEALRYPLEALGYQIIAELPVFGVFDRAKVKTQEAVMQQARQMGRDLAQALSA